MTINRLNQGVTNQVLVKAVSGQTTPLLELQDSTGAVVSSIGPTGALGGTLGNSGLVHINTTSFSAVASQSINDVFSADYKNYMFIIELKAAAGTPDLTVKLRASGSDTSANYQSDRIVQQSTTVSGLSDPTGTDNWYFGSVTARTSYFQGYLFQPFLADRKLFHASNILYDGNNNFIQLKTSGSLDNTTAHDGITLITTSSTISGFITIFGVKN
jgi:hypothetical protein